METSVLVAIIALGASLVTATFTFIASRRTSDDSHTIDLINASQTALEQALERTTAEVHDSRAQIAAMRSELREVRTELDRALEHHAECERARVVDTREIAKLRAIVEGMEE